MDTGLSSPGVLLSSLPHTVPALAPVFVNAKAADVILSDVRPTSITPEALRAVNIMLDELLWLILAHARSFETSRLKTGVLKAIPTQLGKDAILEAEIEIRGYRDKTQQARPRTARPPEEVLAAFPLQEAFDFLRYKCQVLCSFGEIEEDLTVEGRLLETYRNASPVSPAQDFTEPAPLYVTAVIEYLSQHILSDIAKVVARDSGRAAADLPILYTALCEDHLIYPVFKNMKVQAHISQYVQTKAPSLSHKNSATLSESVGPEPVASPASVSSLARGGQQPGSPSHSRFPPSAYSRPSDAGSSSPANGGSTSSLAAAPGAGNPSPNSRASNDSRRTGPTAHHRSHSLMSGSGHASDRPSMDGSSKKSVFDELLESGGTMKVSLTPDRMKSTFDVSKEKAAGTSKPTAHRSAASVGSVADRQRPTPAPITTTSNGKQVSQDAGSRSATTPQRGMSTPPPMSAASVTSNGSQSGPTRGRDEPIPPVPPLPHGQAPSPATPAKNGKPMAFAQTPAARASPIAPKPIPAPKNAPVAFPKTFANGNGNGADGGMQFKNKRTTGRAHRPESMDLDDIMNGDDDDEEDDDADDSFIQEPPKLAASTSMNGSGRPPAPSLHGSVNSRATSAHPTKVSQSARDLMDFLDSGPADMSVPPTRRAGPAPGASGPPPVRTTKVSQNARDLMDFLDSAPPDSGPPPSSFNDSMMDLPPETPSKRGGRLTGMMARLRKGSSAEKLTRTRSFERLSSSTNSRPGASATMTPGMRQNGIRASPYGNGGGDMGAGVPGQIPRHRSQHNLNVNGKAVMPPPPSSWLPPKPPAPPMPPQPSPMNSQPVSSYPTAPQPQRQHSGNAPSDVLHVERGVLPSPARLQFGRPGTFAEERRPSANSIKTVESPVVTEPPAVGSGPSSPANVNGASLSRGSSMRKPVPNITAPLRTVPETGGPDSTELREALRNPTPSPKYTTPTASGANTPIVNGRPSLSRSSSRKPPPSDDGLLDEFGRPLPNGVSRTPPSILPYAAPAPSKPPGMGYESSVDGSAEGPPSPVVPVAPARSPLRNADRNATIAAATAAMAAEAEQQARWRAQQSDVSRLAPEMALEDVVNGSKAARRPQTPTELEVEMRARSVAVAQLEEGPQKALASEEPHSEPVVTPPGPSTETAQLTMDSLAPPSGASPSQLASSIAPSSVVLDEDFIERASDLRKLLNAAKHVEEARLLVDMFFIQSGVPIFSTPAEEPAELAPTSSSASSIISEAVVHEVSHIARPKGLAAEGELTSHAANAEPSVIESLLGETSLSFRMAAASATTA